MIELIFIILIIFSIVFFLVWFWFFKNDQISNEKKYTAWQHAFDAGNYKKAKSIISQVSDFSINNDAKSKLGLTLIMMKEYDAAKTLFEEILKNSPSDTNALSHLAQIYRIQGRDAEALDLFTKILANNDKDVLALLNIGSIKIKQKCYTEALDVLEKAKITESENINVLFLITKCKGELCNDPESCMQVIEEYKDLEERAISIDEYDISFAKLYAKAGKLDDALQYCKKALERNDADLEAYRLSGLIQLISNDLISAKNSLTMALNLQPGNVETHNIFSYLLCNQDSECEREACRLKYYNLIENYIK